MDYQEFLKGKLPKPQSCGVEIEAGELHESLFHFQRAATAWAIKKGRAAMFLDTGLGKTRCQVEWARVSGKRVLILAPLAVAEQTIEEAAKIGVEVKWAARPKDEDGIWITNYQKLDHFIGHPYDAIVLDESSILKSLDGKTRTMLIKEFSHIPRRLCCTATPAPNDLSELANHAEFLGVMTRAEMLAHFFVHDSEGSASVGGWRLKGHAQESFWRWVAQWAVWVRRPSDLGFSDEGFILPELTIREEQVDCEWIPEGELFPRLTKGIKGRGEARRHTLDARIQRAHDLIVQDDQQWLVWCGLNDEGRDLHKMLTDSVLIEGATKDDEKVKRLYGWKRGESRVLISKASMFGHGLNLQNCHQVMYLGLGDSFESYYQSVRRCWRFGQTKPVNVVIVTSTAEVEVVENVKRKEKQAAQLAEGIINAVKDAQIEEVTGEGKKVQEYETRDELGEHWTLMLGDSIERIKELPTGKIGMSVYSPPFASLYTYSASERDLGNCKDYDEFFKHYSFLIPELLRVTMPGRRSCVHVQQVITTKSTHGVIGWRDFRADVVRAHIAAGWVYDGEVVIDKDPQAQAIRTKSKALMFVQKNKDSAWSRPAMADYILLFRAPGENLKPVDTDVSNEEWILWARPIWYGIKESDTLNAAVARENADDKHICPLQLGTIERCIRLWSNKGDIVLDPFNGIGSSGYVALQHEREYIGIELKPGWFRVSVRNLKAAVKQDGLFSSAGD